MGYWVDMEHPYITYDNRYIETLWWMLKELYKKGLLYKGYTIQPFSPAAGTGLSTHELNQPGCYKDVKDTTCTAQFKVVRDETSDFLYADCDTEVYFLAWTTTPWTLPSNTALAVGPSVTYVRVRTFNPYTGEPVTVVLAKDLVGAYFSEKNADLDLNAYQAGDKKLPFKVLDEFSGSTLSGVRYEQLIPWIQPDGDAFRVIPGDYVTTEDGTGIVHIAPTFGADDDRVAKVAGIAPLILMDREGKRQPMVDRSGKFFLIKDLDDAFVKQFVDVKAYSEFAGRFVKNAYDASLSDEDATLDVDLSVMLKKENKAFRVEKHVHNYPHCWRTDKPVLYYPLDSWFVKTTAMRERMMELNNTINWKPESTGTGRFGKWLENLVDWNLSRSRYWGTPLPVWRSEDGSAEVCIGSVEELMQEVDKAVKAGVMDKHPFPDFKPGDFSSANYDKIDLHRPFVDDIILVSEDGKPMYRELDLIDVWFDSGAMPYAQMHYPFENKDSMPFPADFIAEGVDQTRGWFFTLHALGTMLFDSVAFKNIISNGLVLDKKGNKMSKRLGNAVDPFKVIEGYGSDPLRWYMMTNAQPWDNLKFDLSGVDEVKRKFFGTLYNTYSFFSLYANVDGFKGTEAQVPVAERPEIDRWVISLLNTLVKDVHAAYDQYEPTRAGRAIQDFVTENLSNWYVRLNRKRFWGGAFNQDKLAAYQTLHQCLETVALLAAPIAPFYMEQLYRDLQAEGQTPSVHLALMPEAVETLIDKGLEERMAYAQQISSMVLALRRKVSIKVRQPLQQCLETVALLAAPIAPFYMEQLYRDLQAEGQTASVHLALMPEAVETLIDKGLEERMAYAQQISSMVLALRRKVSIKVRQPLQKIMIPILDARFEAQLEAVKDLILNEVNVKELEYLKESTGVLVKTIKPNFKSLGPKYSKLMKPIAAAIGAMTAEDIAAFESAGSFSVEVNGEKLQLLPEDVEIISEDIPGWLVANEGRITVALDITISEDLRQEGYARELVNRIQNLRKDSGLDVTDKIRLQIQRHAALDAAVEKHRTYISSQTLASDLQLVDTCNESGAISVELESELETFIAIEKV